MTEQVLAVYAHKRDEVETSSVTTVKLRSVKTEALAHAAAEKLSKEYAGVPFQVAHRASDRWVKSRYLGYWMNGVFSETMPEFDKETMYPVQEFFCYNARWETPRFQRFATTELVLREFTSRSENVLYCMVTPRGTFYRFGGSAITVADAEAIIARCTAEMLARYEWVIPQEHRLIQRAAPLDTTAFRVSDLGLVQAHMESLMAVYQEAADLATPKFRDRLTRATLFLNCALETLKEKDTSDES